MKSNYVPRLMPSRWAIRGWYRRLAVATAFCNGVVVNYD
jgi:hypothetical protein